MNNIERDKFLTIAMGECWHEAEDCACYCCKKCGLIVPEDLQVDLDCNNDFSTWEGFGRLLEWCQEQNDEFLSDNKMCIAYLTPDRFANSIYRHLNEN